MGTPTLAPPRDRDGGSPDYGTGGMRAADNRFNPTMAAPQTNDEAAPGSFPAFSSARPIDGGAPSLGGQPSATGSGKPGADHLHGPQAPSLTVEQTAPEEVQVGKPAHFEVRVRNVGPVAAHDVQIKEEIPQGAELISTNPRADRGQAGELIWSVGTLKSGEECKVRLELMPTSEGELGSVARVTFAAEASARTVSTKPELRIEAIAPQEVLIGQKMHLKIRVSNPGTGVATGVILSERTPANLAHEAGPELEYDIGNLKPKEAREIDLVLKAVQPGPVLNVITVKGDGQLKAEHKTPLTVIAPALNVALDGPRRRYLDRQAVYTVWVSNPGTASAEDVELTAALPPGMDFVAANNAGQFDPKTRTVQWLLEELPPNQKGSVSVTMLPVEAGEQKIKVSGIAKLGLAAEKQEAVLIEGVAAILFEVADVADPVEVGGETTYEIRVVNQGSKAAANVQLVAFLPPEMKPLAAEGPTRYEVNGSQIRFQELPKLAPKADTTYRVRVQCNGVGDMRVRVQLTTDDVRAPITKEESTRVYSDR
jgi:uncharacterized repeat protein (TIGR01451 family)